MARIRLGTLDLDVVSERDGSPRVRVGSRQSQPGDGRLTYAEWRVDGHDFNSIEQIPAGAATGYLGRSYGANTDGRNLGRDGLGPLVQTIALNGWDTGTGNGGLDQGQGLDGSFGLGPAEIVQSAAGAATITPGGVPYAYVRRGSRPGKFRVSTLAPASPGLRLDAPATDIIATVPTDPSVRAEISIAQGTGSAYQVLQEGGVGTPPATDTWAANSAGQAADVFGIAPDRTVLVTGNAVKGNIQTGTVTMKAPSWSSLFTLPIGTTGTGFALDGNLWIVGTTDGPMVVDADTGDPFPLIPELSRDSDHCKQMATWFPAGVIIPLRFALRYQRFGTGRSMGPETFLSNTSPVQGQPTAVAGSDRELFTIQLNPTGDSYLIAWMERRTGDQHDGPFSPYVLAKFTAKQSRFLKWLGTANGVLTSPMLIGGYGSDAFAISCGRTTRWIDDTAYTMAASGTTYLTETRRQPGIIKDVEFVEFRAIGTVSATKTITVGLSLDGSVQSFTAVTSAGYKRLLASSAGVPTSAFQNIHTIAPQIAYASDSSTAGPAVEGPLRVYYRLRPTSVRTFEYDLLLRDDDVNTPAGYETAIRAYVNAGATKVEDVDSQTVYVKVLAVSEVKTLERGSAEDRSDGLQRYVTVSMDEWTAS